MNVPYNFKKIAILILGTCGFLCVCLLGFFLLPDEVINMFLPTRELAVRLTRTPYPTPSPIIIPAPALLPSPTPTSRYIIFATERLGYNRIYFMDVEGKDQRLLVPYDNGYDFEPAISPDGTRLAFVSNRERPGTDNIYVYDFNSLSVTRITSVQNRKNASPSWFPDGRHLAFTSNRDGPWQIYTMTDDGGNVKRISDGTTDDTRVAISPDGTKTAWICNKQLCIAGPTSLDLQNIPELRNGLRKDHPAWSPNSTSLAFTQWNSSSTSSSVFFLDMTFGEIKLVAGNGGFPNWSPDGSRIVFSSDMSGFANLYIKNLTTNLVTRVTSTSAADYWPVWIR